MYIYTLCMYSHFVFFASFFGGQVFHRCGMGMPSNEEKLLIFQLGAECLVVMPPSGFCLT